MEHYATAPNASMDMHDDPKLRQHLKYIISTEPLSIAVETGTHLGVGSTRILAECFEEAHHKCLDGPVLHTMEANIDFASQARINLHQLHSWVDVQWGLSVNEQEAIGWMSEDRALRDHNRIHGVWIDDTTNPIAAYTNEMRTDLQGRPENLLQKNLLACRDKTPLIVLDSAGGIGLLEFQTTRAIMQSRRYYILLDDVKHIKHYRSFAIMRHSTDFEILATGEKWALARHDGWGYACSTKTNGT